MGTTEVNGQFGLDYRAAGAVLGMSAGITVGAGGNPQHQSYTLGDPDDSDDMDAWAAVRDAATDEPSFEAALDAEFGATALAWFQALHSSARKAIVGAANERRIRAWGP